MDPDDRDPRGAKICAMGVRVSSGSPCTGSLNVHPDLSQFGLIVPCGLRSSSDFDEACRKRLIFLVSKRCSSNSWRHLGQ